VFRLLGDAVAGSVRSMITAGASIARATKKPHETRGLHGRISEENARHRSRWRAVIIRLLRGSKCVFMA